jgi:hypothetical protein
MLDEYSYCITPYTNILCPPPTKGAHCRANFRWFLTGVKSDGFGCQSSPNLLCSSVPWIDHKKMVLDILLSYTSILYKKFCNSYIVARIEQKIQNGVKSDANTLYELWMAKWNGNSLFSVSCTVTLNFMIGTRVQILYPRLKVHSHTSHTLLCSALFEICHMSPTGMCS